MPLRNGVLIAPAIAVDWDDTCVEGVWPSRYGEWLPGAREGLRELVDTGWDVTIHTCRIAPVLSNGRARSDATVAREIATLRQRLDDADLHRVSIHTSPWKPNATVYLDDRGVRFHGWDEYLLSNLRYLGNKG